MDSTNMDFETIMRDLYYEVYRCAFCGFCEYACPTLAYGNFRRQYGPRGRIQLILLGLRERLITEESLRGIYTCLQCNACSLHCPAKINIAESIRIFKVLISHGVIRVSKKIAKKAPVAIVRGR